MTRTALLCLATLGIWAVACSGGSDSVDGNSSDGAVEVVDVVADVETIQSDDTTSADSAPNDLIVADTDVLNDLTPFDFVEDSPLQDATEDVQAEVTIVDVVDTTPDDLPDDADVPFACHTDEECVGVIIIFTQCRRPVCVVETGQCVAGLSEDLEECDDFDPCTVDDACTNGECAGAAMPCDDANPCTYDECSGGECVHPPVPDCIQCNVDSDCPLPPVTCVEASCVGGHCETGEKDCDDGLLCTEDSCDPATGDCVNSGDCCFSIADCNDGDLCTEDICDANTNSCTHAPVSCEDGNNCTDTQCLPAEGCLYAPIPDCFIPCDDTADCDDGTVCTQDFCNVQEGHCNYILYYCNDSDPCTLDYCDPIIGCTGDPNPACDSCETDEDCVNPNNLCFQGSCEGHCVFKEVVCNDNDPCTDDYCIPEQGLCWFEDHCCETAADCVVYSACEEAQCLEGSCIVQPLDCNDMNPCTQDQCDPTSGCYHETIPGC